MAIPAFDGHGLLPAGVHVCTFAEISSRFSWNPFRLGLFDHFQNFVTIELRPLHPDPVFLDGSFVTDKDMPEDTDVVLDVSGAPDARKLQALMFMVNERARLRTQYSVDFWVNLPGLNDFTLFFQYVGVKTAKFKGLNPKHHKGILKLA